MNSDYDIIVIGASHTGVQAVLAEATMAKRLWPLRYAFMYMSRIRPMHGLTVREQASRKN